MVATFREKQAFDIRKFKDKLKQNPNGEKNKCECPSCGGNNLSINPENGAYTCYDGCDHADVREALSPWSELTVERGGVIANRVISPKSKSKQRKFKPATIPSNAKLVLLAEPATDCPVPQKPTGRLPEGIPGCATETIYEYSSSQWVKRYQWANPDKPKGYDKTFRQFHRLPDGKPKMTKGDKPWRAYRLDEALEAASLVKDSVPALLWGEGEKCVEIPRSYGIASLTLQGSAWSKADMERALVEIKESIPTSVQVLLADPDNSGRKKADAFSDACAELGMPCLILYPTTFCKELPFEKSDIEQVLAQMDVSEFIRRIEQEIHAAAAKSRQDASPTSSGFVAREPNVMFNQKAFNHFFGKERWICADGKLYRWDVNFYREVRDALIKSRVANFCNSYSEVNDAGEIDYPYAKSSAVEEVFRWAKSLLCVDPESLNPPGINCTNGIVRIDWSSVKPIAVLIPHSPDEYYTYPPLVKYDPSADTADCDRLLACLDPAQQEVLLRNLGAAFDLEQVRKKRGREVKLLLCCGLGSNGKDALREVVSTIFGHQGITSVSLADFAAYDDGRKFALAPLMHSRVNWASENPMTARIDKIQSLKLYATGNVLHAEHKGKDHLEFRPLGVGLFNLNDVPSLQGTLEATKTRVAVLRFRKTYKKNPDPSNPSEMLADPRFAYCSDFVQQCVAPAFLNRMIKGLQDLISEGIDYECTEGEFLAMQKENNHLFQFFEDTGLRYSGNSSVTAKELWARLEEWYQATGTLTYNENGKAEWSEQARPSDRNIKAINQVLPRISALFPNAQKSTMYDEVSKRTIQILKGIGFINENTRTIDENTRTKSAPIPAPETTENQDSRTTRTNFYNMPEKNNQNEFEKDNFSSNVKEQHPLEIGAGGAEPLQNKENCCGFGAGTGAGEPQTGAGSTNTGPGEGFNASANARLMVECLQKENAGLLLDSLVKKWDEEQKAAVRRELTPEQKTRIREELRKCNAGKHVVAPPHISEVNNQELADSSAQHLEKLPPVGQWVWLQSQTDKDPYQVVSVSPHLGKVELESQRGEMGHYLPSQFTVLDKQEIIQLGLTTAKVRSWEEAR